MNSEIIEYAEELLAHQFEQGLPVGTEKEAGGVLGYITITCKDCGMNRTYTRGRLPKWAKQRLNAAFRSYKPTP